MFAKIIVLFAATLGLPTCTKAHAVHPYESLVVTTVPDYVRPYVVNAYTIPGVQLGSMTFYFPVTGPSSDDAFTLQVTSGPTQNTSEVAPHTHVTHYENFFCVRGRVQLWAEKQGSQDQQARILYAGDYGAVPLNTIHTFKLQDPFSELVVPIQPGGFEKLYYNISQQNYTSSTWSPYLVSSNYSSPSHNLTGLDIFDVHPMPDFVPRYDFVNGTAPASATWHDGSNELASDSETPYFVAKDYGPKYLTSEGGFYQVIQPIITPTQSAGNLTFGTINMSHKYGKQQESLVYNFPGHHAFEVLDGRLSITIGNQSVDMTFGDVAFVPSGTDFWYYSSVAFTKILYVGQGSDTLDQRLLGGARTWHSPLWPANFTA